MSRKYHLKGLVKNIKEVDGKLEGAVASSDVMDRTGEVVKQEGLDISNFKKNPILLWAHNAGFTEDRPPIGKVIRTWIEGKRKKNLMFSVQFDMDDEFARMIYNKYTKGFLNAFSIGFMPLEKEDNIFTKSELLEISAVPVPANPEALTTLKSANLDPVDWKAFFKENKVAIPFTATPTLPEFRSWVSAEAKKRIKKWATDENGSIDLAKYKKGFAWYDSSKPELLSSYKLPHHDIDDGQIKTVWRGVAAAMAALLGARGGVDIPESDKKAVYNHIKKHYAQYEKPVPEFRNFNDISQTFSALFPVNKIKKKKIKKRKVEINIEEPEMKEFQDLLRILVTASNVALKRIKDTKSRGGEK